MSDTTPPTTLIETSFADAILAIEDASDLPDHVRQHWPCSLRRVADALDRPIELVPARWTSIRFQVEKLHHARVELSFKTLANHKANARAALRWLAGEQGLPTRGAPLDERWAKLRDAIRDKGLRARLYGLMRYASAQGIAPEAVNDAVLEAYLAYREKTTSLASGVAAARSIARSWNRCGAELSGWPQVRLVEPGLLVNVRRHVKVDP
jgi:hypothetical protein